jgi:hypothetical protein
LLDKYTSIGPKWAQLALFFDGRTDIDVKNRYHRLLRSSKRGTEQMDDDQAAPDAGAPDARTEPPSGSQTSALPPPASPPGPAP